MRLETFANSASPAVGHLSDLLTQDPHPPRDIAEPLTDVREFDRVVADAIDLRLSRFGGRAIGLFPLWAEEPPAAGDLGVVPHQEASSDDAAHFTVAGAHRSRFFADFRGWSQISPGLCALGGGVSDLTQHFRDLLGLDHFLQMMASAYESTASLQRVYRTRNFDEPEVRDRWRLGL